MKRFDIWRENSNETLSVIFKQCAYYCSIDYKVAVG